jgi:2-polyprenyl-3-methyl-5-hydroxy-6-metoxy-1,4-benzoquinol methylase
MSQWRDFFDRHAPHYMENRFVKNTLAEVDFIEKELSLTPNMRVLDVGCGAGRHSVELAKRGYCVTGIDFSQGMLEQARQNALTAGVSVDFVETDARSYRTEQPFDAAICLCEGGMGLIEMLEDPVEHDSGILQTVAACLKPGAPFLLTALNGYRTLRSMTQEDVVSGRFDPATMVATHTEEMELPEGKDIMKYRERLFTPPEMSQLLKAQDFEVLSMWGGTAGSWNKKPLNLDEIEMMFVCRRLP